MQEMRGETILGWDCEWFDLWGKSCIAHLIQIGGESKVWIVDGVWLAKQSNQEESDVLFSLLFESQTIVHVFMGKEDIRYLKKWVCKEAFTVASRV